MRDEIKTDRLVLRQLRFEDAPEFSKLADDYDISKMTGSLPHPFPLLSAEFKVMYLMSHRRRGLAYPYAITVDGGELMGVMDLFRKNPNDPLEIGYWIGRPYWGQGYITEAARAIIAEARNTLGVKTLVAGAFADNAASLHILKKLGFKVSGQPGPYFSNARLASADSIEFELSLDDETPLPIALSSRTRH